MPAFRLFLRVSVVVAMVAAGLPSLFSAPVSAAPGTYDVPVLADTNPATGIFEATIVARIATVDLGGVTAEVWTYGGTVPGPEIRVTVGDTVRITLENQLPADTSVHWHGIELNNFSDGTAVTQNGVAPGESFLYEFEVTRAGVFWYHPHFHATNPVFRGQYGSLIVTDPDEQRLIDDGVLPGFDDTETLVLADTTVCKAEGFNDKFTFYPDPGAHWAADSGVPSTGLTGHRNEPTPEQLCETRPMDGHGHYDGAAPFVEGQIPNIQVSSEPSAGGNTCGDADEGQASQSLCRVNPGQLLLTNGALPGARPRAADGQPGEVAADARLRDVDAGQGIRLQLLNTATTRFVRLELTDGAGQQIDLLRIGGEGGLLDEVVIEGGVQGAPEADLDPGEILLAPADRADVVAVIPASASGVLTLWALDYAATGRDFQAVPTVPAMHLAVSSSPALPAFTLAPGDPLLTHPTVGRATRDLSLEAVDAVLLDSSTFTPPQPGSTDTTMRFQVRQPNIDGYRGKFDAGTPDYRQIPSIETSRFAEIGGLLELRVRNETRAHHPYHLHGFSIQPLEYRDEATDALQYAFPYREFVDNVDVPPDSTLVFRVHLEDRPKADGVTAGGGEGRWVFHCHIFTHASLGMISELQVVGDGAPSIDVDVATLAVDEGDLAEASGTYAEGEDPADITASIGSVEKHPDGTWDWQLLTSDGPTQSQTVEVTIADDESTAVASFELVVNNTAPDVSFGEGQGLVVDEGTPLPLEVFFEDRGWGDTYDVSADAGHTDASADVDEPVVTDGPPADVGTVAGVLRYGDDGTYTASATVTDDDGAVGSADGSVTVRNVAPTPMIDRSAASSYDGTDVFFVAGGDSITFDGVVTDPGSDDLRLLWDLGDGSSDAFESRVNLLPDPDGSPSNQPRNVSHSATNTYAYTCLVSASLTATDDDGGTASDLVPVLVQGNAAEPHRDKPWRDLVKKRAKGEEPNLGDADDDVKSVDSASLQCYLDTIGSLSGVFDETTDVSTLEGALVVLEGDAPDPDKLQLDALDKELLVAWLNLANGAFTFDTLVIDSSDDGLADVSLGTVLLQAESRRLDPAATKDEIRAEIDRLKLVNRDKVS